MQPGKPLALLEATKQMDQEQTLPNLHYQAERFAVRA
jgi:hypothetical protein